MPTQARSSIVWRSARKADYWRSFFGSSGSIDEEFDDRPIAAFSDDRIRTCVYSWRCRFASPRVANPRETHLVRNVSWAKTRGHLKIHHIQGVSNLNNANRGEVFWTSEEIDELIARTSENLARAMILVTESGLRLGDLSRLDRRHIDEVVGERCIRMGTGKSGGKTRVDTPFTCRLAKMIDGSPKDQTFILVGARGSPWKKSSSISHAVTSLKCDLRMSEELHYHDARGACVTRLDVAGTVSAI